MLIKSYPMFSIVFLFFSSVFCLERLGILIGFFICSVSWFVSTFFVTNIVVYGNNKYSVEEISSLINSLYSTKFILKSNIDTKKIEQKLVSETQINSVSCIIKGNSNIKEELQNSTCLEGEFSPIISIYDGRITSINVVQGTAKVEVGQIIKLGDILVEPQIIDASGNVRQVQPIADIVCDVWITSKIDVYDEQEVVQKTGNCIKSNKVIVFGKTLYDNNISNPYKQYQEIKDTKNITNFILPIKLETTIYEETKTVIK